MAQVYTKVQTSQELWCISEESPSYLATLELRKRGRNVEKQKKLPLVRKEVFSTYDLGKVIPGLDKDWVQRMVQDEHLEIWPSVMPSTGVGTRKEWSREDVYLVALCWWLYEAGFRLEEIEHLLTLDVGLSSCREGVVEYKKRGSMVHKTVYGVTTVVPVKKLFEDLESRMYE